LAGKGWDLGWSKGAGKGNDKGAPDNMRWAGKPGCFNCGSLFHKVRECRERAREAKKQAKRTAREMEEGLEGWGPVPKRGTGGCHLLHRVRVGGQEPAGSPASGAACGAAWSGPTRAPVRGRRPPLHSVVPAPPSLFSLCPDSSCGTG
jgi:hypothetical protein